MNGIIRIDGIECYEKDGTAYLKLDTVARGLGFTQTAKSGNEVVRWERVNKYLEEFGVPTCGHDGSVPTCGDDRFIPENVFYRLAMKAKNAVAEAFQAKIADEVIPSIRRHGMYATPATVEAMLADPDTMIRTLQALKDEREARIEAEGARDRLLHSSKTYTTTEIAKELGMRSAQQLNRELEACHVQFRQNGTWLLYSRYAARGYTSVKQTVLDTGRIIYDRRWTGDGRDFLLQLFA